MRLDSISTTFYVLCAGKKNSLTQCAVSIFSIFIAPYADIRQKASPDAGSTFL